MIKTWENATIETLGRIQTHGPIPARFSDNGIDWENGYLAAFLKRSADCRYVWIPDNYETRMGFYDWAFEYCQVAVENEPPAVAAINGA